MFVIRERLYVHPAHDLTPPPSVCVCVCVCVCIYIHTHTHTYIRFVRCHKMYRSFSRPYVALEYKHFIVAKYTDNTITRKQEQSKTDIF